MFISARGILSIFNSSFLYKEGKFLNTCAIGFRFVSEMGKELGHQH